MNIAVLGIRGIPANYGGFETFAEELAVRLVCNGNKVTVYGRKSYRKIPENSYKGVQLVFLPTIRGKYFETVVHTFLCILHSFFRKYDIIFICNAANSIMSFIPRLSGKKVIVNVDGLERKRKKWNFFGRLWYLCGEVFSLFFPNAVVTDAKFVQEYYLRKYNKITTFIPYGAHIQKTSSQEILNKYNLEPNGYFLYVSRLEPENNAHIVIQAFKKVKTQKKLVIVGDAPYAEEYKKYLRKLAEGEERIIFTGYVFGVGYKEFQGFAYAYIHASEIGGTPPALIGAMGFGNCILANGTEGNCEVVGNTGIVYNKNDIDDLALKMEELVNNPEKTKYYGKLAEERVRQNYSWDFVINEYEKLFASLMGKRND